MCGNLQTKTTGTEERNCKVDAQIAQRSESTRCKLRGTGPEAEAFEKLVAAGVDATWLEETVVALPDWPYIQKEKPLTVEARKKLRQLARDLDSSAKRLREYGLSWSNGECPSYECGAWTYLLRWSVLPLVFPEVPAVPTCLGDLGPNCAAVAEFLKKLESGSPYFVSENPQHVMLKEVARRIKRQTSGKQFFPEIALLAGAAGVRINEDQLKTIVHRKARLGNAKPMG